MLHLIDQCLLVQCVSPTAALFRQGTPPSMPHHSHATTTQLTPLSLFFHVQIDDIEREVGLPLTPIPSLPILN